MNSNPSVTYFRHGLLPYVDCGYLSFQSRSIRTVIRGDNSSLRYDATMFGQLLLKPLHSRPQFFDKIRLFDEAPVVFRSTVFAFSGHASHTTSSARFHTIALSMKRHNQSPIHVTPEPLEHTFTLRFWQLRHDSVRRDFLPATSWAFASALSLVSASPMRASSSGRHQRDIRFRRIAQCNLSISDSTTQHWIQTECRETWEARVEAWRDELMSRIRRKIEPCRFCRCAWMSNLRAPHPH